MSENKKYFYLKLKENFFQTNEMRLLKSMQNGVIFQNIYLQMCLLSLQNDGALTYKNMIPYDIQMLSVLLDFEVGTVKLAIEIFERIGLITITDTNTIFMADIQTLIGQSSTEAERQQKYRQRIKEAGKVMYDEAICESVTNDVTESVTEGETNGVTEGVQMLQQMLQNRTPESESKSETELEFKDRDRDRMDRHCVNASIPEPEEVYYFYHENELPIFPERFWNYNYERDWKDTSGKPIQDWKSAYLKMCEKANPDEHYDLKHKFEISKYKGVKEIL